MFLSHLQIYFTKVYLKIYHFFFLNWVKLFASASIVFSVSVMVDVMSVMVDGMSIIVDDK